MHAFPNILKNLMQELPITAKELASKLGFYDSSIIYRWLKNEKSLLLQTAVALANIFDCSLNFLFGRSDSNFKSSFKECPPFDLQFRKVLKEQNVSQIELLKNKIVSRGNLTCWLTNKQNPRIDSVIRLADYLHVTMDYLVGRED